jgi:uncharacterized membrane protein YfcA
LIAGIVIGFGAILGGVVSARLANTFSEKRLAQVAGGFFIFLGIVMTLNMVNANLAVA